MEADSKATIEAELQVLTKKVGELLAHTATENGQKVSAEKEAALRSAHNTLLSVTGQGRHERSSPGNGASIREESWRAETRRDKDVEVVRVEVIRTTTPQADALTRTGTDLRVNVDRVETQNSVREEIQDAGMNSRLWCCAANKSSALALPAEGGGSKEDIFQEEVATGPVGKARRTAATMLLGAKIHFSSKKLEKELKGQEGLSEDEVQERWSVVHRANAKLVFEHIMKYRGFFIKVGQKASTMHGLLADAWVEELEPLQDHLPISPFAIVQRTILEDFHKPLTNIFCDFEQKPIASASIGQAHVAHLMKNGEKIKVCVKVQHPGVYELASTDLNNLEFLLNFVMKMHDEAPDVSDVMKSMKDTLLLEVDFTFESDLALDACAALGASELDVACPEPIRELCSPRVMTMRFIEGWKITEVEKMPPEANREAMAASILEAWAMLAFEHGLIHGDPHPGNIFVEELETGVRPVLLDWGMAMRATHEQRVLLAKWVVAALSRDRFMYLSVLKEMGMEFTEAADYEAVDLFRFGAMLALRDTVPAESIKQFHEEFSKQKEKKKEAKEKQLKQEGKKIGKVIGKVPGWNRLMFRGLGLLQDVCSMLDVSVPFAKIMLKYALPLLGLSTGSPRTVVLPYALASDMELAVRAKLTELDEYRAAGMQVAVLSGTGPPELPGSKWRCSVVVGKQGVMGAPLSELSLMPLLDASVAVLIPCLLATLSHKTVTGKEVGLDTPVERLWPEFSRGGKAGITIRDLFRHQGCLGRPFRNDTNNKSICSEQHMEKSVAACPSSPSSSGTAWPVIGIAAGALLRRSTGHKTTAEAVKTVLEPLGLHEDIAYSASSDRLTHVAYKLCEEINMATIWEMVEAQERKMEVEVEKKLSKFLTWEELGDEKAWCTDPLLINSDDLQSGKGCMVGRGLRATARAVCQLYASGAVPEELVRECCTAPHRLQVESLEEWEGMGCCLDVGVGWQLFKFRKVDGAGEVVGYGHVDGTTGSIILRVLDTSIAILSSSADESVRHVGHEVISVIAAQLGLEPLWKTDRPNVPERALKRRPSVQKRDEAKDVQSTLVRIEAQVARLTEALSAQGHFSATGPAEAAGLLNGTWTSAETEGMDAFFDVLQVPAVARQMARQVKTTLDITVSGNNVSNSATMSLMGRQVHKAALNFTIGEPFEGEQFGGHSYKGQARWEEEHENGSARRALLVEKSFRLHGQDICWEERFEVTKEGRLVMQYTVLGQGRVLVALQSRRECDQLRSALDAKTSRVKKEVKVGGRQIFRGGVLVSHALADLSTVDLPTNIELQYDDLQARTMFDCSTGPKAIADGSTIPQGANHALAGSSHSRGIQRVRTPGRGRLTCCTSVRASGALLCSGVASVLHAMGRALEGGHSSSEDTVHRKS